MKVLHAAETIKGGVATVINSIVEYQLTENEGMKVMCLVPSDQEENLAKNDKLIVQQFSRDGRNLLGMLNFAWMLLKIILKHKPDIIHLHSTFAGVIGRIVIFFTFKRGKIKVFYCPHAFSFLMNTSNFKKKLYVMIEKVLQPLTNKIICVSKTEYEQALSFGFNENKLILIYNGVKEQPIINTRDLNNKGTYDILFVGRFDYQKGVDILQDAILLLQGNKKDITYNFTIIGEAVNDNSNFKFTNLNSVNIKLMGWVKPEQLNQQYLKHDLIIIPSRWEGFAMVPLEAMSFGLPIIASDIDPFKEIITTGQNGILFSNLSPNKLYKILYNINDFDLELIRKESTELLVEKFTQNVMCKKTIQLYYS